MSESALIRQEITQTRAEINKVLEKGIPQEFRLSPVLSEPTREIYEKALTSKQRDEFEAGLHTVDRWEAPRKEGFPIKPGFHESNLQHTHDMLQLVNEYEEKYPHLAKVINFDEVRLMILMHDSGEIIVGDVPATGPGRENMGGRLRKKMERPLSKKYILSQIEDDSLREQAMSLYDRVIKKDPKDLEAQLACFIDKVQATARVAPEYVFAGTKPNPKIIKHVVDHMSNRSEAIHDPAFNLRKFLPNENSVREIEQIERDEQLRVANVFMTHPEFYRSDAELTITIPA